MDELLAGLGKMFGSINLGGVDLLSGSVAVVALLVALRTQRRQTVQGTRAQALQMNALHSSHTSVHMAPHVNVVYLDLHNTSDQAITQVLLEANGGPLDEGEPSILIHGFFDTNQAMYYGEERSSGERFSCVYLPQLPAGQTARAAFFTIKPVSTHTVRFNDSGGRTWVKDFPDGEPRLAKKQNRKVR